MSTTDGLSSILTGDHVGTGHSIVREQIGDMTLSGTLVLTLQHRSVLRMDPGGSGRTVTLPAEEGADGVSFEIVNTADGAEALTVENDAAGSVVSIAQNEKATVYCDGAAWYHSGITTIALS